MISITWPEITGEPDRAQYGVWFKTIQTQILMQVTVIIMVIVTVILKNSLELKKRGESCDRHGGVVIVDWRGSSRPGSQRWHHFSRNPLQRCLGGPKGRNGNTKETCSLLPDGSEFFHRISDLPLHKSSGESVSSEAPPAAASSDPLANVQVPFTYRAKVAASSPRPRRVDGVSEQRRSAEGQLANTQWLHLKSPAVNPVLCL